MYNHCVCRYSDKLRKLNIHVELLHEHSHRGRDSEFMLLLLSRAQLKCLGYVRFSKLWITGRMAHWLFEKKYTTRKSLWVIFLLVTLYSWDLNTNTQIPLKFCNCYVSYWWDHVFIWLLKFTIIFFSWSNNFLKYQFFLWSDKFLEYQ